MLLPRLKVDMSVSWALPVVDDFIIQCGRLNEFIIDTDICLHSIVYVRNAIAKSEPIEFNVIPKTDPSLDLTSDNGLPPEEKSFCSLQGDTLLGFDFCACSICAALLSALWLNILCRNEQPKAQRGTTGRMIWRSLSR